jgi:hypothetical protein
MTEMEMYRDEIIDVLHRMVTITDEYDWFNFKIDKASGKVYFATEFCLEVISIYELIDRLVYMADRKKDSVSS